MNTTLISRGRSNFSICKLLAAIAVVGFMPATLLRAQTPDPVSVPSAPDIETSNYTFAGEVNAEGSLVRSGPSENDYPVLKLAKGAKLTVVGMRFEWLKVEPPEGSFCLVSQAFVDKRGDGTVGKIVNNRATVRIGSAVVQSKHKVPTLLDPGTDVQIIGEADEYYKIVPPKGVYFYIDKKFVDPVRRIGDVGAVNTPSGTTPAGTTPGSDSSTPPTDSTSVASTAGGDVSAGGTPPTAAGTSESDPNRFVAVSTPGEANAAPTTAPAVDVTAIRKLQDRLSTLEDRYTAASQQDLAQQPIDDLAKGYADLLAEKNLPPNARKVAEYRASALQLRKQTVAAYIESRKTQEEAEKKQKDLVAEQKELQERVAATQIKRYAAIGTLASSSIQAGTQPLYRLIDPSTRRTIIYVRSGDVAMVGGMDKFIGITGQVVTDDAMHLTYVQPTSFEVIDAKQVNSKVFSDYAPPSMSSTVAGAGAGGE